MRIVLTGGPGAGKTAVLELLKHNYGPRLITIPEAAGIVFTGGFWRHNTIHSQIGSQRAIFHVQRELEYVVEMENPKAVVICDRGTLDGLAYWPEEADVFWKHVHSSKKQELLRYDVVIHLRTPTLIEGYNHQNPLRIESPSEAIEIDKRIEKVWEGHPHRHFVNGQRSFVNKAQEVLDLVAPFLTN